MTKLDLVHALERYAEQYSNSARRSILQDHRSGISHISQEQVNAVLAGFVNHVGSEQGMEYGLYARDLSKNLKTAGHKDKKAPLRR